MLLEPPSGGRFGSSLLTAAGEGTGATPESPPGGGGAGGRGAWAAVPWRTIIATIGLVGAAALLVVALYLASRVVIWIVIAGFFAVVLARPVAAVQTRFHLRRGAAVGLVVGLSVGLIVGMLALFVAPVRTQLVAALTDLPGTVHQAAEGHGPIGRVVTQLHLEQLVRDNEPRLTRMATSVQGSMPGMIGTVVGALLGTITIVVMTCLMLTQSSALSAATLRLVPLRHRGWVTEVARDAAAAVSGYMIGNLILSVCAGLTAFLLLLVLGAPSPAVLALWVAFADLIPLVGATLGAAVAVFAAFLVSPTAGIVAIVFFALYQQFENGVLQVVVMSRTVRVNPLIVLFSVLAGVELFGFVGALLAVPVAGALSVVAKELWQHRPADPNDLLIVTSESDEPIPQSIPPGTDRGRWRRPWRLLPPWRDDPQGEPRLAEVEPS